MAHTESSDDAVASEADGAARPHGTHGTHGVHGVRSVASAEAAAVLSAAGATGAAVAAGAARVTEAAVAAGASAVGRVTAGGADSSHGARGSNSAVSSSKGAASTRAEAPTSAVASHNAAASHNATSAADAPTEVAQQNGTVYRFGRFIVAPLARLIWRPRITGRRGVPKKGPLILASNHQSFIDSIAIPMLAPRRVQFIAKASYFEGKGLSGWFQRVFFGSVGAVPIQRGVGAAAQEALEQSRRIIESGNALALYPEGTRSLDGRLYKGRTGVAWLVLETGAKVVPVGLTDTAKLMPVGAKVPRLARVSVAFGAPLDFSHLGGANTGKNRREVTDEIMRAIQALTGQEFVDAYNEAPPATRTERVKRLFRNERGKPTLPLD